MQVVILAGGKGTRMYPDTFDRPKSLLDINGKPFISLQLGMLQTAGATEVILLVSHMGDEIVRTIHKTHYEGMNVIPVYDAQDSGTGQALWDIRKMLKRFFVLTYGDVLPRKPLTYKQVYSFTCINKKNYITTHIGRPFEQTNVALDEDCKDVLGYGEWDNCDFVDSGIYGLQSSLIDNSRVLHIQGCDLKVALEHWGARRELNAIVNGPVYDVGSHRGLRELREASI